MNWWLDGWVGDNKATLWPPTDQLKLDWADLSVGARCDSSKDVLVTHFQSFAIVSFQKHSLEVVGSNDTRATFLFDSIDLAHASTFVITPMFFFMIGV